MIAQIDAQTLTPEAYLELEAQSNIKHEYIAGAIYAMAGTTDIHNIILGNLVLLIRSHLRGTACQVYFADMKVRLEQRDRFYYPDLFVTCDRREQETSTYKRFPKLVIEILSESTEAFDRGDKFNDYQTLENLEEYVLVNSKQQRVEIFRRNGQGEWRYQTYGPIETRFNLQSLELTVFFSDLYEDVSLDP